MARRARGVQGARAVSKFRIIGGTEPPAIDSPIADQIRAIAEEAIRDGAQTFVASWGVAGNDRWGHKSAPDDDAVMIGHAIRLVRHVRNNTLPPDLHIDEME